jgi:hypothetical protein
MRSTRLLICISVVAVGAVASLGAGGCGSSSSNNSPKQPENDGATASDDSGDDAQSVTTDDGGPETSTTQPAGPVDAGNWTPSNFTLAAVSALTPVAIDEPGCTADTDTGTWSCNTSSTVSPPSTTVTLAGAAGNALVWYMTAYTLDAGDTLNVSGSKPAIFYVSGPVQINGAVVVTAGDLTGGVGVGGAGYLNGNTVGGGGGGGFCGTGGAGDLAIEAGVANPPAGGSVYGTQNLIPLVGGSVGGTSDNFGGGVGGGALQITSGNSITVTAGGSILAGGAGPGHGSGGSGAGSGGAILLEAPSVAIAGNLSANGGGASDNTDNGNNATINASPAPGGGTGGGAGSYSSVIGGANGTGGSGGDTEGGGGGGAGRIRINTANGSIGGIITPSLGDGGSVCSTVGPLP